jgi:hypothetical protein
VYELKSKARSGGVAQRGDLGNLFLYYLWPKDPVIAVDNQGMAPSKGVILVLLLLAAAHCFAQEILRSSENTTVFLNQPAVFTCETRGGSTVWRVNGTQREAFPPDVLRDLVTSDITTPGGVFVTNLTIPARAQYNGTRVQCLSVLFGNSAESEIATLNIIKVY